MPGKTAMFALAALLLAVPVVLAQGTTTGASGTRGTSTGAAR